MDDRLSSSRPVAAGVSQSSVLAPTLYLIFINDIPTIPTSNVSLFADDTMFYIANCDTNISIIQVQRQLYLTSV